MFNYEFMRLAFLIGLMLGIIIPLVGQTCVLKRLSTFGDAISHTSLLGVAIGLVAGFSPLILAIFICVVASLVIELIRRKFSKYSELSVVIVMSASIALATVISKFSSSANFSSYLFGSILLISLQDIIITAIVFVIALVFYIGFYHQIKYVSYNEVQAKLDGVNVGFINIVQMILTAVIIAISAKVIGALMVSALMIIPYSSSIQLTKSYKHSVLLSIVFSLVSIFVGLTLAYYFDLQSGGTIVICSTIILIISLIVNRIFKIVN